MLERQSLTNISLSETKQGYSVQLNYQNNPLFNKMAVSNYMLVVIMINKADSHVHRTSVTIVEAHCNKKADSSITHVPIPSVLRNNASDNNIYSYQL